MDRWYGKQSPTYCLWTHLLFDQYGDEQTEAHVDYGQDDDDEAQPVHDHQESRVLIKSRRSGGAEECQLEQIWPHDPHDEASQTKHCITLP